MLRKLLLPLIEKEVQERIAARKTSLEVEADKLRESYGRAVVPAFEINGVQYYELPDIFSLPTGRALAALDFYKEVKMSCDRETLIQHCEAFDKIFNSKSIDLMQLAKIQLQLKEKLEMIATPDLIYKLASVCFFDKTESLEDYDFAYGQKKIAEWKASKGYSFFLLSPVKKLIPFMDLSDSDLETYMKVAESLTDKHKEVISMILSGKPQKKDLNYSHE